MATHRDDRRAPPGDSARRLTGQSIARSQPNGTCRYSIVLVAGLVAVLLGDIAHASDRTIVLQYICDTYRSARQVALERRWDSPEHMPGDCRTLFRNGYEVRIAEISRVLEVVPIDDGRWVMIGKVRRGFEELGYSAGIAEDLLLY